MGLVDRDDGIRETEGENQPSQQVSLEGSEDEVEEHEGPFEKIDKPKEGRLKPSIEEPPELELKTLLDHLEYVFLDEDSKLPVIIAANLSPEQKGKLVSMLKRHKSALAWKISDIKGINPSFCTHKILMEDNFKSVIQPQRRLNPNMKEVVKA